MVYFPKTGFLKRVVDEFLGFLAAIFISRLVVATTGGSAAFAGNLLVNALANGAGFAVVYGLWPHVFLDMTVILCKFFDDMVQWLLGLKNLMILDFAVYIVLVLAQFVAGLLAYLFIWVFIDESKTNLGLPSVPSGVSGERAFGGEALLSMFFVFGFFYISQMYNKALLMAKVENMSAMKDGSPIELGDGMMVVPDKLKGVDVYATASWSRALLLGLLRFGLAAGGVPITGGLFNVIGYLSGAIVSWTWVDTYYVHIFGPLVGIAGYIAYVCAYYIPKIDLYTYLFGVEAATPQDLSESVGRATRLPTFKKMPEFLSEDSVDFYSKSKKPRRTWS